MQCLVAALPIAAIAVPVMIAVPIAITVAIAIMIAIGGFGVHHEVCATAPVDPDAILVECPRSALCARRAAALPLHRDATARVCRAVVTPAIFRSACEDVLRENSCSGGEDEER